jgi:hypothetical protein
MIKRAALLLSALIVLQPVAQASSTVMLLSFGAAVSFGDAQAPVIAHAGLTRISPVTKYAVFKGTATDETGINTITVNYFIDDNPAYSTSTISAGGRATYEFVSRVRLNFIHASKLSYRITSTDLFGNKSYWPADGSFFQVGIAGAVTSSYGIGGGRLVLYDGNPDDETVVDIPAGALDAQIDVSMGELDPADDSIPPGNYPALTKRAISVYRFEPSGIIFKKPVKLSLLFPDVDRDGVVDGTTYNIADLKVMWWDGFEWRVMGTGIDAITSQAVTWTKHFSLYAVFPVSALTDDDYRPKEKIITPASIDGFNDFAVFGAIGINDTVNIFDVNGRRIRQLKNDNTIWDGKDDNGKVVESGLYIYQIKLTEKIINGTIVVAK